jgi:hypothetical protein
MQETSHRLLAFWDILKFIKFLDGLPYERVWQTYVEYTIAVIKGTT